MKDYIVEQLIIKDSSGLDHFLVRKYLPLIEQRELTIWYLLFLIKQSVSDKDLDLIVSKDVLT